MNQQVLLEVRFLFQAIYEMLCLMYFEMNFAMMFHHFRKTAHWWFLWPGRFPSSQNLLNLYHKFQQKRGCICWEHFWSIFLIIFLLLWRWFLLSIFEELRGPFFFDFGIISTSFVVSFLVLFWTSGFSDNWVPAITGAQF